jgi:hypothetical protein
MIARKARFRGEHDRVGSLKNGDKVLGAEVPMKPVPDLRISSPMR